MNKLIPIYSVQGTGTAKRLIAMQHKLIYYHSLPEPFNTILIERLKMLGILQEIFYVQDTNVGKIVIGGLVLIIILMRQ